MSKMNEKSFKFPLSAVALTIAVVGNIAATLVSVLTMLQIPPNSDARPMQAVGIMFLISAATLLLAWPLSFIGLWRERPRRIFVAGATLCLALTPFFFSGWIMFLLAGMRGIYMEP